MKIVFMGTPEFAVPALKRLHQSGHAVVLVITPPDRPRGRGQQIFATPVKKVALELNCPISQPDSIRTEGFIRGIQALRPDVIAVVAFGRILPADLLSVPRFGCVNIHASLLPKYRGPAPIQWAIINAEKETGVTTMLMDPGLDTGDILLSQKTDILPGDTAATLHDRLAGLGAEVIIKTLQGLSRGEIKPLRQNHAQSSYAPLLHKSDGHIDWAKPAHSLAAFIRGVTPWPGAFTFHAKRRLKIYEAEAVTADAGEPPGTVIKGFPGELRVMTGDGALLILEIQGASAKRLPIKDFLKGNSLPPGTVLD